MDKKTITSRDSFFFQLLQVSVYYQLKYGEAIASTLIQPSMRKSQIKLVKANSNLRSDDINTLD